MKRLTAFLLLAGLWMGCSNQPNAPEHICEVYMSCINAKQWELAAHYVFDTKPSLSLLQVSPLLTKNYRYRKFKFLKAEYAKDSSRVRVHSVLTYADHTYLDSVFLLEKDPLNIWKIRSL